MFYEPFNLIHRGSNHVMERFLHSLNNTNELCHDKMHIFSLSNVNCRDNRQYDDFYSLIEKREIVGEFLKVPFSMHNASTFWGVYEFRMSAFKFTPPLLHPKLSDSNARGTKDKFIRICKQKKFIFKNWNFAKYICGIHMGKELSQSSNMN